MLHDNRILFKKRTWQLIRSYSLVCEVVVKWNKKERNMESGPKAAVGLEKHLNKPFCCHIL
jgi:hypothetical protein